MKYLSLFSGIGGFELGIQQAYEKTKNCRMVGNKNKICPISMGQETEHSEEVDDKQAERLCNGFNESTPTCIGYSEVDKYAIQIYQKHFPEHKNYGDITKINEKELPDFDLLVGGFPCQPFSIAGSRKGFDDYRGTLFFDIARIIKEKRPKHLLLENVGGLLSHDSGRTYKTILSEIAKLGYDTEAMVFDSINFDAAPRKRIYMFATDREQKSNIRERSIKATPLYTCSTEGARDTHNQRQPKGMRDAERIVRTFAKLPEWLDSWDTIYTA